MVQTEATEKHALREKSVQEMGSCHTVLDSQVISSSGGQIPFSRDPTSASRAMAAGSLHFHKCTENMGSPAWGPECAKSGGRGLEEYRGRQSPPQNLYPYMEILTFPPLLPAACAHLCSSSPRCWERSSGSTEYMSSSSNLRL